MPKIMKVLASFVPISFMFLHGFIFCKVILCDPIDLINSVRFDVIAKYIYAKHRELGVQSPWALDLYREHLHVWVNFFEKGSQGRADKTTFDDFLNSFNNTLDSIKKDGFDPLKSVVPLGKNGISNGAHRVAACLLYDKQVAVETTRRKVICHATADFFKHRDKFVFGGLEDKHLDAISLQYCELKPSCCFFMSKGNCVDLLMKKDQKDFDVVYAKTVSLSRQGRVNLLSVVHEFLHNKNAENRFCKLIQSDDEQLIFTVALLDQFCLKHKHGISGMHDKKMFMSRSHNETLTYAQTFFNKNSIDCLNTMDFCDLSLLDEAIDYIKDNFIKNQLDVNNVCLVPFYTNNEYSLSLFTHGYDDIIIHILNGIPSKFVHFGKLKNKTCQDDVIFNPENFFYYKGLKFVTVQAMRKIIEYGEA